MKHFREYLFLSVISLSMLGYLITIMLILGFSYCIYYGSPSDALTYMLEGANASVELMLGLAGSYLLWMGILNIALKAGLIDGLASKVERPLRKLMPNVGDAAAPITLNLAANFFGLGNAATPFGLEAMKKLYANGGKQAEQGIATNNICMFLALNASAVELLPTTVIAIRAACGSTNPNSIVLPTFISSVISAVAAVLLCRLFERKKVRERC